jgi:hypothetical protein
LTNLLSNGSFFAATTHPADKGNATAFQDVNNWVFPVVLSWSHLSSSSPTQTIVDTQSHVSCVRANNVLNAPAASQSGNGIVFISAGSLVRSATLETAELLALLLSLYFVLS